MTITVNFIAPNVSSLYILRSGLQVTSAASGLITLTNPVNTDIVGLLAQGCVCLWQSSVNKYLRASGTFTANGVTGVVVTDTGYSATDIVEVGLNTIGGTVGAIPHVSTGTAATSFTMVATASDTSVYNYQVWSVGAV